MKCNCSRREFLMRGLYGMGVGATLPLVLSRTSAALAAQAIAGTSVEKHPERILVVVELSGGNDGLNTVVPYGDAAYYRARPKLGIRERDVITVAPGIGFHPSMVGFERLYKDGHLAVVHGCGYDRPSLSHFSSMDFWHTGAPNTGESLGWLGRLADATYDPSTRNMIVNLGTAQSLAVRSQRHSPLVFDDPSRFRREGSDDEKRAIVALSQQAPTIQRDARFPDRDRRERGRELRLRAPGVGRVPDAGRLRHRRRAGRQPPARRGAHRRRHAHAVCTTSPTRGTPSTRTSSRPTCIADC